MNAETLQTETQVNEQAREERGAPELVRELVEFELALVGGGTASVSFI